MPTYRNRPAIDYGAVAMIYIPPFYFKPNRNTAQTTIAHQYVLRSDQPAKRKTSAPEFGSWSGTIIEDDLATAAGRFDDMALALRGDASGYFDLYLDSWTYFKDCYLPAGTNGLRGDFSQQFKGIIPFSFNWQSRWPNTFTAGVEVPAGPWEAYITNGQTGVYTVATKQKTTYQFTFPGEIDVTDAGYDFIVEPEGEAGDTLEIVSIQGMCQSYVGAAGNSLIRVCDKPVADADTTNSILLTQAYNSLHTQNTGSFTITAGDLLYVFCETANGHLDLCVTVVVEG